jgi:hypothetical protein
VSSIWLLRAAVAEVLRAAAVVVCAQACLAKHQVVEHLLSQGCPFLYRLTQLQLVEVGLPLHQQQFAVVVVSHQPSSDHQPLCQHRGVAPLVLLATRLDQE